MRSMAVLAVAPRTFFESVAVFYAQLMTHWGGEANVLSRAFPWLVPYKCHAVPQILTFELRVCL